MAQQPITAENTNPACARCRTTMTDRGNEWFCSRCIESPPYVGLIQPRDPDHPAYDSVLRNSPEVLLGRTVNMATESHDTYGHIGEVRPDDDEVVFDVVVSDESGTHKVGERVENLGELISEIRNDEVYLE